MTIFDLIQSQEISAYWDIIVAGEAPFFAESLFPNDKRLGLNLSWIKGTKGLPVVLKVSAFDTKAIPRPRIGFDKISTEMPFFKESKYIDEETRQQLNIALQTGNTAYIDSIVNNVFNDSMELMRGARVARERMRMQLLSVGVITMSANGQFLNYDYSLPSNHKRTVDKSWSDPTADILGDIQMGVDTLVDDTGEAPSTAVCNSVTWRTMKKNSEIKNVILVRTNGEGRVTDAQLQDYLSEEFSITVTINDKKYRDEKGVAEKFMPDNTFTLLPSGTLGTTWFGTTPEESDLMTSGIANVSIVDTGVAVTTVQVVDPVNVETKVTQICLPSFEQADRIYILDTHKA